MFAGLSELADRFSTFMREPMYNLGNSISDYIYTQAKRTDYQLESFIDKVNKTSDPDVLDEVWLVLAKAFDTGRNDYILAALKVGDELIRNCGARFHNSCTPLFMRRLKEMIIYKASVGGAENMKVMNSAKSIVREWGDAFMPYVSQGRGKVIVEGYQDMQRSGIHFPPAGDKPSWTPLVHPTKQQNRSVNSPKSVNPAESVVEEDFDVKGFYRKVKKVIERLEEEGITLFDNVKVQAIAAECEFSLPKIQSLLKSKGQKGMDDDYCSHVRSLISMCKRIIEEHQSYKSQKTTNWSDEPDDDWGWSDDETKKKKPEEEEPSVRKGRRSRRTQKQEEPEDFLSSLTFDTPTPSSQVNNDFDFLSF